MTGLKQRYLFVFVVAGCLGLAAWLVFGLDRPAPKAPEAGGLDDKHADGSNAAARDGKPQPRENGDGVENGNAPTSSGNAPPDAADPPDLRLPDPAGPTWDPASFRNETILWRLPRTMPDAARPLPADEYNGTPVFITYGRATQDFLLSRGPGHAKSFDPAQPNGMLVVDLRLMSDMPTPADEWVAGSKIEAVSYDGASVYAMAVGPSVTKFAIPYSFDRKDVVGLTVTGRHMLPVEAVISQYGGSIGHHDIRESILLHGFAYIRCRVFPADYADFRAIQVIDAEGRAIADAMLTHDCVQIFGRSDSAGILRFPWPAARTDGPKVREKSFFLSAPGYVPVLLEHSELVNASGPVQVTLRAHELLVAVHQTVPDPQVLKLGVIVKAQSEILKNGADLIPIPDEYPEVQAWEDVSVIINHRGDPERVRRQLEGPRPPNLSALGPVDYRIGAASAGIFQPGHKFGDFGARKLGEVLGRTPTENWPQYAHWYCGRWDYDEREGRFDVALPYAGRFLLLVGEYNRGVSPDARNGKVTHALYIDARDLSDIRSKLIIHPLG